MKFEFYKLILLLGLIIIVIYLLWSMVNQINKQKYTIIKNRQSLMSSLRKSASRNIHIKNALYKISIKLGMFNNMDMNKNLDFSFVILICFLVIYLIAFIFIMPMLNMLWYIFVLWLAVITLFAALFLYVMFRVAIMRFTSKLTKVFKVINSRYMDLKRIDHAIEKSLPDMDGAVRKEMIKVYDVLKINNAGKINFTFNTVEKTYNNEYLTFLLELIKQAHFKGGSSVVIEQFEEATSEILMDIEGRKDLSAASRLYMILTLFFPVFAEAAKSFNRNSLGVEASNSYYSSPAGVKIYILIIILSMITTGFLIYLERKR